LPFDTSKIDANSVFFQPYMAILAGGIKIYTDLVMCSLISKEMWHGKSSRWLPLLKSMQNKKAVKSP